MIKELCNWIKLFFWLRKKENNYYPETHFYEKYTDELVTTVRTSVGYREQENPVLWILFNNLLGNIERRNEMRNVINSKDSNYPYPPLTLDCMGDCDYYNAKGFNMTLEDYQELMGR